LRFTGIVGTGGIGAGWFFRLNHNHTLGREESRSGRFLDMDDYCKQHIILHYTKVLLGPSFVVTPIGRIGDDETGSRLYREMQETGFVMTHVDKVPGVPTLFSFCFYYPDGTGGNLTTDDSASARVDEAFINRAGEEIRCLADRGMVLAVPEVPLGSRHRLLELGRKARLFCAASFTSEEIPRAMETGILDLVDLLAINIDEACSLTGIPTTASDVEKTVLSAREMLGSGNREIMVSVTAGMRGSWCFDGKTLSHFPAVKNQVKSTAGAGDAFLAGLLCGIALGLELSDSQQLATLVAGLSVASPHTIHKGINRSSLNEFMVASGMAFREPVLQILQTSSI